MDARGADVWLILPTYNEADNIEGITAAVRRALPRSHRILVVDDASPDGTGQIADRLAAEHDDLEVLHRPAKSGLGPAYIEGFRRALAGDARRVTCRDSSTPRGGRTWSSAHATSRAAASPSGDRRAA